MGELHLWKPSYLHPHHHPAIPFMIDIPFPEKMKHPFQATPRISSSLITINQPFSVGHPLINYYPCCIMFDKSFVINEWIFHNGGTPIMETHNCRRFAPDSEAPTDLDMAAKVESQGRKLAEQERRLQDLEAGGRKDGKEWGNGDFMVI